MDTLCMAVNVAAALTVMVSSLLTLNTMGKGTCHLIRSAFILLAVGGFAVAAEILARKGCPSFEQTALNLGMAAFCVFDRCDRRRRIAMRTAAPAGARAPTC